MKGPNPFSPFAMGARRLAGRKHETSMFNSILKEVAGRRQSAALVVGGPGIGKSALLSHFAHAAEKKAFFSLLSRPGKGEATAAFLERLGAELRNHLEGKAADGTISGRALKRILDAGELMDIAKAASRHSEGTILMVDDADRLRDVEALCSFFDKELKGSRLRIGVVFSSTKDIEGIPWQRMALEPFDEHDAHEMIGNALGKEEPKMGEGCFEALFRDSGGNPLVLSTMCYVIYEKAGEKEKILTRRHYIVNSSAIMAMLSRDFFDPLWQALPKSERRVLAAFAEAGGEANISDIAKKTKMRHATTLALRLMERGQLVRVDRGIYRVFTRMYSKYALARS